MEFENMVHGNELSEEDKRYVLSAYTNRYTKEHTPKWAATPHKPGKPYPVQFENDEEWLKNTKFSITSKSKLDGRCRECYSSPTWPNNPELRHVPQAFVTEDR